MPTRSRLGHATLGCRTRAVLDAKPEGWFVGRPSYEQNRREWVHYAYDPHERAKVGHRSREWTAVAATGLEVVREMGRCLREIRLGHSPV